MNRAKLLMLAGLLTACAGFVTLSQSVHAGSDEMSYRAELSLALAR